MVRAIGGLSASWVGLAHRHELLDGRVVFHEGAGIQLGHVLRQPEVFNDATLSDPEVRRRQVRRRSGGVAKPCCSSRSTVLASSSLGEGTLPSGPDALGVSSLGVGVHPGNNLLSSSRNSLLAMLDYGCHLTPPCLLLP